MINKLEFFCAIKFKLSW